MMTRKEFVHSLQKPLSFWQSKTKEDVRALLGDAAAQMVGFKQRNPHHCYDLFLHALHTVDGIHPSYSTILRVAAFFHDIGKPSVAFEKQGRLVFYGHARKSAEIVAPILAALGFSTHEVNLICFYISHHDDFISWVLPTENFDRQNPYLQEITLGNVEAHIRKVMSENSLFETEDKQSIWLELTELCRADVSAQAEFVYRNDKLIDSKAHKIEKIDRVREEVLVIFSK